MINTSGKQYSSREHGKVMDTDTVYRTEEPGGLQSMGPGRVGRD